MAGPPTTPSADARPSSTEEVLRVKLFGMQAQLANAAELAVPVSFGVTTVAALRDRLAAEAPAISASLGASRFAVNHAYAAEEQVLAAGDEVALVGLVGGG